MTLFTLSRKITFPVSQQNDGGSGGGRRQLRPRSRRKSRPGSGADSRQVAANGDGCHRQTRDQHDPLLLEESRLQVPGRAVPRDNNQLQVL